MRRVGTAYATPCPVTFADASGGTAVDVTEELADATFRHVVGIVSTHTVDDLTLLLLRSTKDQTRILPFTLPAGVLLPIRVDLGNPAARPDNLWLKVTGTKAAGENVRITFLLE